MNRWMIGILLFQGIFFCNLIGFAGQNDTPNPKPIFARKGFTKENLILKTVQYEKNGKEKNAGALVMRNKMVFTVGGINGARLDRGTEGQIRISGSRFDLRIGWATWLNGKHGDPFPPMNDAECAKYKVSPAKVITNSKTGEIRYEYPYLLPKGGTAVFTWSLEPVGAGLAKVTWNTNSQYPTSLIIGATKYPNEFKGKTVKLNGKRIDFDSEGKLAISGPRSSSREIVGASSIEVEWDDPVNGYHIYGLPEKCVLKENIYGTKECPFVIFGFEYTPTTSGTLFVDLGECEMSTEYTDQEINGINLMETTGIEWSKAPTRNQLRNPSFEQGLRFWVELGVSNKDGDLPPFELSNDAKFGKKSLRLRSIPGKEVLLWLRPSFLRSIPMPLKPDTKYTLSFYAKKAGTMDGNLEVGLSTAASTDSRPGGSRGDERTPERYIKVTDQWQRYSRTFEAGRAGFRVNLMAGKNSDVLVDGFQLEEGSSPTPYVCDPVEADLVTSESGNQVIYGDKVNAVLNFYGAPGTKSDVNVKILNFYRELVHEENFPIEIGTDGSASRKLSDAVETLGKGVFIVRIAYKTPGFPDYFRFQRYMVLTPLDNTNPTYKIPGTHCSPSCSADSDQYARRHMEWGFGSTSWAKFESRDNPPRNYIYRKKYRIKNMLHVTMETFFKNRVLKDVDFPQLEKGYLEKLATDEVYPPWTGKFCNKPITEKQEKLLENAVYEYYKNAMPDFTEAISWSNEEEHFNVTGGDNFDEYLRFQRACLNGAKRALPNIRVGYSCGISSITDRQIFQSLQGYLKAANKAGVRYDVIPIHTYGHLDGGKLGFHDLDAQLTKLIGMIQKYGYGKETPIYITECSNEMQLNIPDWNTVNGDAYSGGEPSYSWNHYEALYAASMLRYWIMALKFWPQVQSTNIWNGTMLMDAEFMPIMCAKTANTFGNLFPWAEFVGDVRPGADMRGYVFKLKDGTGIAALWQTRPQVDMGIWPCPEMKVKFTQDVEFLDSMENARSVKPDVKGIRTFALTWAPLFIKAKNPGKLLAELNAGTVCGTNGSSVRVAFKPQASGRILMVLSNVLAVPVEGGVRIGSNVYPFKLAPVGNLEIPLKNENTTHASGTLYDRSIVYTVTTGKDSFGGKWHMSWSLVPRVVRKNGKIDWDAVPASPINNVVSDKKIDPKRFSATYRLAWDPKGLYLKVNVTDSELYYDKTFWSFNVHKLTNPLIWKQDGCLEVYLDSFADGRAASIDGYGPDDWRYDFCMNEKIDGPCYVWPQVIPDKQLIAGLSSPSFEELRKNLDGTFKRTSDGYTYTIFIASRYVLPFKLESGACGGFAICLHDWFKGRDETIITNGTKPGKHVFNVPNTWPLIVLE